MFDKISILDLTLFFLFDPFLEVKGHKSLQTFFWFFGQFEDTTRTV